MASFHDFYHSELLALADRIPLTEPPPRSRHTFLVEIADNTHHQESERTYDGRVVVRLYDPGDVKRVVDLAKALNFLFTPVAWQAPT